MPTPEDGEPSPSDPDRAAEDATDLDAGPTDHTAAEATESDESSLPPGASKKDEA